MTPLLSTELTTDPAGLGYAPLVAIRNDAGLPGLLNMVRSTITIAIPVVTKDALKSFLALAISRVYATGFAGSVPYWTAILQLWSWLDTIGTSDPGTQAVIARALIDGVLLQSEVTALTQRTGSRAEQLWGAGTTIAVADVSRALNTGAY